MRDCGAGYGKTTLVNLWLESREEPLAWLSLDEGDSSLAQFVAYLAAAVRSRYPASLPNVWSIVNSSTLPEPARLADLFLQEAEALPGPLLLVIDDYHAVSSLALQEFVSRFLHWLPDHIQLVLISRADPPLALTRLRARRQLLEIRSADLCFTPGETGDLLVELTGVSAGEEVTALLHERTEGWPAGLQLAAIALAESGDAQAFAQRFARSGHRLVSDYLLDEVLERLDAGQRMEMLRTALLDQFCASLCTAVAGPDAAKDSGRHFIDDLLRANLFVLPLDDAGLWYRYHHLFRDLLRNRLRQTCPPETILAVHASAAGWYRSQGLIGQALSHLVAGDDLAGAQRLLVESVPEILTGGDRRRLERWLAHLPPPALDAPVMRLLRAFVLQYHHQVQPLLELVDAAEAGLLRQQAQGGEPIPQLYLGLISVLRAASLDVLGDVAGSLAQARQAVRQLPAQLAEPYSMAEFHLLDGLRKVGEGQRALALAQQEVEKLPLHEPSTRLVRLFMVIGSYHHTNGDASAALATATMLRDLGRRAQNDIALGWGLYGLGWAHYERDRLDEARAALRELLEHRFRVHARAAVESYGGLALICLAQGDTEAAARAVQDLREFLLDRGMGSQLLQADVLDLRVALADPTYIPLSGEVEALTNAVQRLPFSDLWREPRLTAVRANLRLGRPPNLETAAAVLADLRVQARSLHNRRKQIQAAALACVVQAAHGDQEEALASLEEAVLLGRPVGALRSIADAGAGIRPFLRRLLAGDVAPDYVRRLLAHMESDATRAGAESAMPAAAEPLPRLLGAQTTLKASLTNREMDVLLLLARRLTNKEIGAELSLSPHTVKKHSLSLYQKLGVNSRRQAVARAEALGLL